MKIYAGRVRDGKIVLEEDLALPEGACVRIEIMEDPSGCRLHPEVIKMIGSLVPGNEIEDYYEGMRRKHE